MSDSGSTAADKFARLLLAFEQAPEAPLAELARASDLPKSTTHRLLATFKRHGLVDQTEHGAYRLGFRVWQLGQAARPYLRLVRSAQPYLRTLAEASAESAFLTVPEQVHSVCVASADGPRFVRLSLQLGSFLPLHQGASNRILLAFLPSDERDAAARFWVEGEGALSALHEDLDRIRRDGYVCTSSQLTPGATAIAVPVLDQEGALIAGLSLGGPTERFDEAMAQEYLNALRDHARSIARDVAGAARTSPTN